MNEITVKKLVTMDTERISIGKKLNEEICKEVMKSQAVALKCETLEESECCNSRMVVLREFVKNIEEHRLSYGRVITGFKKVWDKFWNNIKEPAETEVTRLKGLLASYHTMLRKQQEEEEAKRQAEIAKREKMQAAHAAKGHNIDETPREALVPEVAPIKTKTAARMRDNWVWEIVDETQVPREYLCIDSAKITRAVKRKEDPIRQIPGIKIENRPSVI